MRRLIASFVLSLMAWSLAAPVAMAASGTAIPACCRRNGKHHCMSGMSDMGAMLTDDAPVFAPILLVVLIVHRQPRPLA